MKRLDSAGLLGIPDPARDRLLLSALAPRAAALAAWRQWEALAGDREGDPVATRWLPLIGRHLESADLSERSRRRLDEAWRGVWAANIRVWTATEPALDRLDAAGIEWILLKGAALAWTVYESAALRAIGDVDVLVRPGAAARAAALLETDGWRSVHHTPASELDSLHAINYTRVPHGALDLHQYVLRECCWPAADTGLWERSVIATIGDRSVRVLSPADQLLHVCVHGLRWNPVHSSHWVADAAWIIARADVRLDWPTLAAEAHRRDLAFQVREALALVRRVAGAIVPDGALAALASGRRSWPARIECHVKARPLRRPGGLLLMWYDWRRLRNGRRSARAAGDVGFARYLAYSMRLPSPRALWSRAWQLVTGLASGRPS